MDRHLYFVHALPTDQTSISLPALHLLLLQYIARNDDEIALLQAERQTRAWRKSEGKTKREVELDSEKEKELSEYRSGFSLPDLTLVENVFLTRQWISPLPSDKDPTGTKGGDPSFLGRIRLVRIFEEDKSMVLVVQEGAREGEWEAGEGEVEMGEVEEEDDLDEEEIVEQEN